MGAALGVLVACSHDVTSPTPALSSVAPDLVCNGPAVSQPDGITPVTLTGSDFTPMPSHTLTDPRQLILPQVTLGAVAALPGGTMPPDVQLADDPAAPDASRLFWTSESSMGFYVDPADMQPTGVFDVTVTNPDKQRATTLSQVLAILPPPVVTAASPMAICDAESNQMVEITGTSFLVYSGATPTVTIDAAGGAKTYPTTVSPSDCMPIAGSFSEQDVALCTKLTFQIPAGDITVSATTMFSLVVTNPAPADCQSSTAFMVSLDAPPTVDSVVPSTICQGGAHLTINGSNFLPGATVELVCPSATITNCTATVNAAGTQISATCGGGAQAGDMCDVVVANPDGCTDVPLPHKTVRVSAGPLAFLVDPNVVYNGINTVVTIYATTITWPVTVSIQNGGTPTALATLPEDLNHPNRVQAIVPVGLAAGTYDVMLSDSSGCPTDLPAGLRVVDDTDKTITLKSVVPPFGVTGSDTAVEVFRDTTAVAPNNTAFAATPRVYLNPTAGTPTDVAVALDAVTYLDGDRVTGIVPAATPAHVYDVIVVNPDGTLGVLPGGYTEEPPASGPPEIDTATPSSIIDATNQHVTLVGKNFAADDVVTIACETSAGVAETIASQPTATAPTCSGTPPDALCSQAITINGSGLAPGSACVLTLTNPTDGTYGVYSAIGVTNNSLNLSNGAPGLDMNVGRRALVGAAGNATAINRFVYALGGDDGTPAGAMSSIELVPIDLFGHESAASPWRIQPPALRANTTLAGAVTVGRYIYVVGGNDGTGAVQTAERGLILSPTESPEITDVDFQLTSTGLDPGTYHYRVAAVFDASDPDNPGGESLASDELSVTIPDFSSIHKKVQLTLVFRAPVDSLGAPLPNVVGYRIYRTAKNGGSFTELLLGTSPATPLTFLDDGSATPAGASPLPLGTTGNWAALPNLSVAREGPGVAFGRDPGTAGRFYVYALLGRDASMTALASYEYLRVDTAANGHQTTAAGWTSGTLASTKARWQLSAWTVDASVSPLAAYASPTTFVFLGGGMTGAGAMANTVEAGEVSAGGELVNVTNAAATTLDTTPTGFPQLDAGYGVCAANNQLYAFGGLQAAPTGGAQSATLASSAPALAAGAWNNEGIQLANKRYLMGSAVQSALIFLLGGDAIDALNVETKASKSTEQVIW
ncbi:MAG: hypothetical protein ACM31C_05385 [Acidobacteriota bacterium]